MIAHVILCLNEREIEKKKREKRETINQEDQISELTFNFHGALSILTFFENELTLFTEKSKRKTKKRRKEKKKEKKEKKKKRKKREKEGETRRKKRKEKLLFVPPYLRSQFLCDLLKTCF